MVFVASVKEGDGMTLSSRNQCLSAVSNSHLTRRPSGNKSRHHSEGCSRDGLARRTPMVFVTKSLTRLTLFLSLVVASFCLPGCSDGGSGGASSSPGKNETDAAPTVMSDAGPNLMPDAMSDVMPDVGPNVMPDLGPNPIPDMTIEPDPHFGEPGGGTPY